VTGIEHQSNIDELRATVLEDIVPNEPETAGKETIQRFEALEVKRNQIIEGNYHNIAVQKRILQYIMFNLIYNFLLSIFPFLF